MTRLVMPLLALAAVGTAGCGGDGAGSTEPPPRACTQIGCESGVVFRLERLPADATRVRVCAAGRCRDTTVGRPRALVHVPVTTGRRRTRVAVAVRNRRGELIASARGHVRMRRTRPNGPGCGPVCLVAGVRFRGDTGTLRALDGPRAEPKGLGQAATGAGRGAPATSRRRA